MIRFRAFSYLCLGTLAFLVSTPTAWGATRAESQIASPTHRQVKMIYPKVDGQAVQLHTMATTPDGKIVAAVGGISSVYKVDETTQDVKQETVKQPSAVLLIDHTGETLKQIDVDITPTAVAVAKDGEIFVGGSGKIIRISSEGEIVNSISSPHAGDPEKMKEDAKEALIEQKKMMAGMFDSQTEMIEKQIAKIEEKDEEDRSKLENAQLDAFKQQLEMYEQYSSDSEITDEQIEQAVESSLAITSMAVSENDLFICATKKMSGYNVWRVDRELSDDAESKVVLKGLSGCCGQMDIQCCDDVLVVGENTRFRVGMYDRDGDLLDSFGKRDRTSQDGFGSCCNPMNTLPLEDGSILTAESSIGHIKRFNQEGEMIAYIGKAKIGGGCKHCSLGYDAVHDQYYMQYQDQNAICVLANVESVPMTEDELRIANETDEFLTKIAGTWKHESYKGEKKSGGIISSLFGGGRGTESPHPIAALEVKSDGTAKILAGMYQAYGDESQISLIANNDSLPGEGTPFAISIDQVEFLTGKWEIASDSEEKTVAHLHLYGMETLVLSRDPASCESGCGEEGCEEGECENEDCEKHKASAEVVVVTADESAVEAMLTEVAEGVKKSAPATPEPPATPMTEIMESPFKEVPITTETMVMKPSWSYKLVGVEELGDDREAELNRLGAEGWEYTGRLGEKMMFKKMADITMGNK